MSTPVIYVSVAATIRPRCPPARYTGARIHRPAGGVVDRRLAAPNTGVFSVNNRVMVKPNASSPELPYAGARVRLHRLLDGYCAWEGISDANGYYWPRGLEVGLWYYPVAIDLTGTHECDAAGPVQAVREGG